jgi:hypothetical protein
MTSGDYDGIILKLETEKDVQISFNTKPAQFSFQLNQLNEPMIVEAGKIDQKVEISRISEQKTPHNVKFNYTDQNMKPGVNAYYVKVLQSDGEKAWSSPIFMNFNPK